MNGLLEELQKLVDCTYLSDLHFNVDREHLKEALASIPESSFPLKEWHDAASYVTGKSLYAATVSE